MHFSTGNRQQGECKNTTKNFLGKSMSKSNYLAEKVEKKKLITYFLLSFPFVFF
jgi:hypothetical protein